MQSDWLVQHFVARSCNILLQILFYELILFQGHLFHDSRVNGGRQWTELSSDFAYGTATQG